MRGGNGIWRALDRARAMNLRDAGAPPPEPGDVDVTRRRVLAAIAGGIGLATLPKFPAYAQSGQSVAIVGGGLAGLAALDVLRNQGVAATLFEARGATGGRTRSVQGVFADQYAFDEGGQLVNTDHADLLGMISRFRIRMVDRRAFGTSHEVQIGRSGAVVAEARLATALRGVAARITADSDRLDADYANVAREIDQYSVSAYLDRHGLAAGDARDALEAAIRTEYGIEPEAASALELLFNLPTVDGRHLNRISTSDERYLIAGGSEQVAIALAAEHRRDIRLNRRLTGLDIRGDSARLTFADGARERFDRVILALPISMVQELSIEGALPPLWRAFFAEVKQGRNEKVIVGYDIPAWRRTLGFGGALWAKGQFSAAWDAVSLAPAPGPGAFCYYLGGNEVAAASAVETAELARRFTAIARRALPGLPAPNGRYRRTRWTDDPLNKGSYVAFAPGQLSRFASLFAIEEDGRLQVPQAGPVVFAGEYISDAWPAYMNGALQTGRIAAQALIAQRARRAAA
jgi:monoamine oxidase